MKGVLVRPCARKGTFMPVGGGLAGQGEWPTVADVSVRAAHGSDAAALARVQASAWRLDYRGTLPDDDLAALPEAEFAVRWRQATDDPPSARHHVLAACAGADVVGLTTLAPAEDPDRDPATDAEVAALVVDPDHRGRGHGSRLLAAAAERLRGDGFATAVTWVDADADPVRRFLESAGWAPDGAHRSLDLRDDGTVVVRQLRLHTDLREDTP